MTEEIKMTVRNVEVDRMRRFKVLKDSMMNIRLLRSVNEICRCRLESVILKYYERLLDKYGRLMVFIFCLSGFRLEIIS